ncbi:DUF3085 domain-containing protein [Bradyrhizobium forestalis]|nr:DUF3085 domain-containing protein [Bradyrhizobium forestalis]
MRSLIFEASSVRRVVDHSIAAAAQHSRTVRNPETGELETEPISHPSVILARDHGLYLMSNGLPRDIIREELSFAAYARGCDPFQDSDWRNRSRDLIGDDDLSLVLPWAYDLKALIDAGARTIVLTVNEGVIEIAAG